LPDKTAVASQKRRLVPATSFPAGAFMLQSAMLSSSKADFKLSLSLKNRKTRYEHGLFLAEGRKIVTEGLQSGCPCQAVYVREGFFGHFEAVDSLLSTANTIILPEAEFRKLAETEQPQGLIGVFSFRELTIREPAGPVVPVLYDVADPRNVGNIIRCADWFGNNQIVIGETCADPFGSKAVRSSMGSIFRSKIVQPDNLESCLAELKKHYRLVVADLDGQDYRTFRDGKASALVFSNEARGPSAGLLALADCIATIPGAGQTESLSVASAAAIMLAALF